MSRKEARVRRLNPALQNARGFWPWLEYALSRPFRAAPRCPAARVALGHDAAAGQFSAGASGTVITSLARASR